MGEDRPGRENGRRQFKQPSGEIVFTGDDIRAVVGMEPLSDAERFRDEADPAEEQDALDLPQTEDEPAPAV